MTRTHLSGITCRLFVSALLLASLDRVSCAKGSVRIKEDPGCQQCLAKASALFAQKEDERALKLLESWQDRCPGTLQLHLLSSTILLRQPNRLDDASKAALRATLAAPGSVPAHFQYALALSLQGANMKAAAEFEKVLELDPANYESWNSLSQLYGKMREEDKAKRCAEKAAALEPGTRSSRLRLLKNLERQGHVEQARNELSRLLKSEVASPEFCQELSWQALSLGAYEQALQAASQVLAAYPRSLPALRVAGLSQLWTSRYKESLDTARKMLSIDPASTDGKALRALALLKSGQTKQAQDLLCQTGGEAEPSPLMRYARGEYYSIEGRFKEASESLNLALDLEPALEKSGDVCFTFAQALERDGDEDLSLRYYRQSLSNGLDDERARMAREAVARLEAKFPESTTHR